MANYRDSIIAHAAAKFAASHRAPGSELFINLRLAGKFGPSVEAYANIDSAAEDTEDHFALGRYFGTLHIAADGEARFIDLSDHGLALAIEAEQDERDEERYERGLRAGAGRAVL